MPDTPIRMKNICHLINLSHLVGRILHSRGDKDVQTGCDEDRCCKAEEEEQYEVVHDERPRADAALDALPSGHVVVEGAWKEMKTEICFSNRKKLDVPWKQLKQGRRPVQDLANYRQRLQKGITSR